jgi:hypothetical protein
LITNTWPIERGPVATVVVVASVLAGLDCFDDCFDDEEHAPNTTMQLTIAASLLITRAWRREPDLGNRAVVPVAVRG